MQRVVVHIISRAIVAIVLISAVAVGAMASTSKMIDGEWRVPGATEIVRKIRNISFSPAKPSKVIYLHRESLQVKGGGDDAARNESSLIKSGELRTIPRYRASKANWRRFIRCVEGKFADYDVVVTDKRPTSGSYILVKVGGKAADIGRDNRNLGGLAPYNQKAIPNSIVFAFDQGGRYRTKNNCDAVAHEVGHVYGLDHTYQCKDIMSYRHGCGAKVFVKEEMACGEKSTRLCEDGKQEQNSGNRLLNLLGARSEKSVLQ